MQSNAPPTLGEPGCSTAQDAHNAWDERTLEGLSRVLKWARSKGVQQVRVHDRHGSRVDDIERVSGGRAAVSTEASGLEHVCELIRSFPEARDAGRFPGELSRMQLRAPSTHSFEIPRDVSSARPSQSSLQRSTRRTASLYSGEAAFPSCLRAWWCMDDAATGHSSP